MVDKSLGCLPTILKVLDFSTIKNELFPVIAAVFSKTSSLGIKIRGLEAFVVLCGGSPEGKSELSDSSKTSNSTILDKYTVQEKIVPLLKVMKTKEPAVMMAALAVFKEIGKIADADFLAIDVLPILWSFSLGPLLNLQQFQEFIALINSLSSKIEQEQTRKLRDLSSSNARGHSTNSNGNDLVNTGSTSAAFGANGTDDVGESDFERLVLGRGGGPDGASTDMLGQTLRPQPQRAQSTQAQAPVFSWSTPTISPVPTSSNVSSGFLNPGSRAITPDQTLSSFATLNPVPVAAAKPSLPTMNGLNAFTPAQPTFPSMSNWGSMGTAGQMNSAQSTTLQPQSNLSIGPSPQATNPFSAFSIAPPPTQNQRTNSQPQYGVGLGSNSSVGHASTRQTQPQPQPKKGLEAYESLI